jgi:hypothetical protein
MTRVSAFVGLAMLVTAGALATWLATGRHVFTKFEVVVEVDDPVDPDDPFAAAGFYADASSGRVERRSEFHLGLLPAPARLCDRHAVSVVSITVPFWFAAVVVWWRRRPSRVSAQGVLR